MSMAGIRDAIKTALEAISGLRVHDTVPESINDLPAAWVRPVSGRYDYTAGGAMVHSLEVTILVQRATLAEGQDTLDSYLVESGDISVKAAIDAASLGSHGSVINVVRYRDYGGLQYAGQQFLGCRFDVEVWT